jgi:hypothetical protein
MLWEQTGTPVRPEEYARVPASAADAQASFPTVTMAVAAFMADARDRGNSEATVYKKHVHGPSSTLAGSLCGNTKHARFIHHQLACPFEAHRQAFGELVYGVVFLDHLDHPITADKSLPNRARLPRRSARLNREAQRIREIVRPGRHALRVDRIHVEHNLQRPHLCSRQSRVSFLVVATVVATGLGADDPQVARVLLNRVRLERTRQLGSCYLGWEPWKRLDLDRFFAQVVDDDPGASPYRNG